MPDKRQWWSWRTLAFAWLILATAVAAAGAFRGLVPLDARTGIAVKGLDAAFEFPAIGAVIEPLMAPAHIILGAPDFRIAAFSTGAWVFVITGVAAFWMSGRRSPKRTLARRVLVSAIRAVEGAGILGLYMLFACLVPLPGVSLTVRSPATIVADLHSHTLLSHDAIASLPQNLAYHRDRGYGVVGITDHFSDIWWANAFAPSVASAPEIVRGVELRFWNSAQRRGYLLALGLQPDRPFPYRNYDLLSDDAVREFIAFVKNVHHGAVVAMHIDLLPEDVERLFADGLDGFEIANFGHPELAEDMRAALLKAQASHHTALLANSDWHGWSGFARTWTVFEPATRGGSRAEQVIDALRDRNPQRIVPVISQMIATPPILRALFAPFVEIVRYASELSPARLTSWWAWIVALSCLAALMRRARVSPGRCFLGIGMLVLGGPLLFRGAQLAIAWFSSAAHVFPLLAATASGTAGSVALAIAALIGREVVGRARSRPDRAVAGAAHAGTR